MPKLGSSQAILLLMTILLCFNYGVLDSALATKGSYPGENGDIAFNDDDPDPPYDSEIFVMKNDGRFIRRLTFNDADDRRPCWSPDGSKIAFEHGDYPDIEIWIMDADGSNKRRLTTPTGDDYDISPAWSPDGKKIAFSRASSYDIYVIDANGPAGMGTILISGPASSPSWSPDGSEIVYNAPGGNYVADASTGALKRTLGEGYDPCWSPDGTKIVFGYNNAIWVMNADGSDRQKLSDPPQQPIEYEDDDPNWSPDGEKIVFTREEDSIWIMNADGTNAFDLTPHLPNAEDPDYRILIEIPPVGGVASPINKLEIIGPYIILGLLITASTIYITRRRKN